MPILQTICHFWYSSMWGSLPCQPAQWEFGGYLQCQAPQIAPSAYPCPSLDHLAAEARRSYLANHQGDVLVDVRNLTVGSSWHATPILVSPLQFSRGGHLVAGPAKTWCYTT
jgi:hypothetical protein